MSFSIESPSEKVSPYMGGIGISSAIVSFNVALYYNTIIAWCLFYFVQVRDQSRLIERFVPLRGVHSKKSQSVRRVSNRSYLGRSVPIGTFKMDLTHLKPNVW